MCCVFAGRLLQTKLNNLQEPATSPIAVPVAVLLSRCPRLSVCMHALEDLLVWPTFFAAPCPQKAN